MAKISKRKARRLRREGSLKAPQPKLGMGHIVYGAAGPHENKKRKALKRIAREELR